MGKVFTHQHSNGTFTIQKGSGILNLSVKNNSASALDITITGDLVVNGISSTALTLSQGDVVTLSSNTSLENISIVSGSASALADIIATQN
jgi:hypothetical protein